jgi:hypothetical protein
MLRQFFSLTVAVELLIAAVWATTLWLASRYYSKPLKGKTVKLKSDYLKTPTSNALTVLGLVVPLLVALTSYLYASRPDADYGSLLSTIILYFGVLILAIWETFALLKKATPDDTIELLYPDDRRFVTGLGLMYGMLVLGLGYFAFFFLFEIRPTVQNPPTTPQQVQAFPYLVSRPALRVDSARDDVFHAWGAPARVIGSAVEYDLDHAVLRVSFDGVGKVQQLTFTRK